MVDDLNGMTWGEKGEEEDLKDLLQDKPEKFIVSIEHLYHNQEELRKNQVKIMTTLENGLKSDVKRNTQSLRRLVSKVEKISEDYLVRQSYDKGRNYIFVHFREVVAWLLVTLLTLVQLAEHVF